MNDAHIGSQWLSEGVEALFAGLDEQYRDVVIVGSGYGGAIAAATLAGTSGPDGLPVTVCVLERGREYLPGSFPAHASDVPGHVRWSVPAMSGPQGKAEGLFDVRIGPDLNALVANGLGGGSLINAGVMLQPDAATLDRLKLTDPAMQAWYDEARALLDTPVDNTIALHESSRQGALPLKFEALAALQERMAGSTFAPVPISVAMNAGATSAGVPVDACIQCGDCATGCNHNAKLSLDTNLLVRARRQGAQLYTGATVLKIEPTDEGWRLYVVHTDSQLRQRHQSAFKVHARKVILAAGTFGSTEILLRSRSDELPLPTSLGQRFSSNGDMLAVAYDYPRRANAVADDRVAPHARGVGPTITARVDAPGPQGARLCFEELAVPAALRRIFEEISTTAAILHRMGRIDATRHTPDGADPCAVSAKAQAHSTILAVMGDDGASGELELTDKDGRPSGDGAVRVRWPALREHPLFKAQIAAIPADRDADETVLPNPAWRLLPDEMERMIVIKRGPLTTVHPLGGCAMGESSDDSVVNENGQVHLPVQVRAPAGTLVVLDGSIVPGALGVNPALTIAALSLRAARALRTTWGFTSGSSTENTLGPSPRCAGPSVAIQPAPTEVAIVERLSGPVRLSSGGIMARKYMAELTLRCVQRDVAELCLPQQGANVPLRRTQKVDAANSELALYDADDWTKLRDERAAGVTSSATALTRVPLGGTLDFMHREASGPWRRSLRGAVAWLRNRGGRDTWQRFKQSWRTRSLFYRAPGDDGLFDTAWQWLKSLVMLASRAGEVRRFDYVLSVNQRAEEQKAGLPLLQGTIAGHKRLTYAGLSNPWSQLGTLTLTAFPGMRGTAVLKLDTDFLVEQNAPLLKIMGQQDQPAALLDLAGLGGFLARTLLNIHMWTFRKPDAPRARTPQRLPGALPGLPPPEVADVEVDALSDGRPVHARLTNYKRADSTRPPVVLIHGYSTSGTAFAHPLVNPNLASYLWNQGRDVWVLDLRTSSGMPYARWPWRFEDVALADIPAAVECILNRTGREQVDVMAHCMGAAMFSMAILARTGAGERFQRERAALPRRIRRLVLSQVGPLVVFTQANVFRAYLMRYMLGILPRIDYAFRVEGEPTLGDELLDRLLSSLPYPRDELARENPWWPFANTEFTGARHRMDALYGRDFKLANMPRAVLANLDDFFGPLNLVTVSQSVHFARRKTITDRAGRNVYVSRANLKKWRFPTLSIHGVDNGLASVATLTRMQRIFTEAACCHFSTLPIAGFGHQDSWLGRGAVRVFEVVDAFFDSPDPGPLPKTGDTAPILSVPAAGPMWIGAASNGNPVGAPGSDQFGLLSHPTLPHPTHVLCVPVQRDGEHYVLADGVAPTGIDWQAPADDDGWLRLARDAGKAGPDGSLILLAYNESASLPGVGTLDLDVYHHSHFSNEWSLPLFPRWRRPALVGPTSWKTLDGPLRDAVVAKLKKDTVAALAPGVLARPAGIDAGTVTFALGSCQYPPGLLDSEVAYRSYARLAHLVEEGDPHAPAFVVLAGDQIYSDASAGLFDPTALDDRYKRPYEKLFSNRHVRAVMRQCPVYMMLDDHELSDNWAPPDDSAGRAAFIAGCEGYRKYQRAMDLPNDAQWYTFDAGSLPFFMADTRTEREARSVHNIDRARIMLDTQMEALETWLLGAGPGPKFVVTSSMLGLRRRELADTCSTARLRCDTWEGYPRSMYRLLAHILDNGIEDVVLLSGDEHISCDLTLTLSNAAGHSVQLRSIHSSALYAPYPFANASAADFVSSPDRFSLRGGDGTMDAIDCMATFTFTEQDGFALLTVGAGKVDVTFDRAGSPACQCAACCTMVKLSY